MKLLLSITLSMFFLASCAHHHNESSHHHHKKCNENCKLHKQKSGMFDKHCAQSISEGDLHVKGTDDYKLEHGAQTYYFSSKEKMIKFKKNIDANANKARKNWETGIGDR